MKMRHGPTEKRKVIYFTVALGKSDLQNLSNETPPL
jgi:hypothetical protein